MMRRITIRQLDNSSGDKTEMAKEQRQPPCVDEQVNARAKNRMNEKSCA